MAKKASIARAIAGDSNIDKMGSFKESTGGGTPLGKGEKLKDHPEAHRVQQPRDEEGKFTYNAVNGKELKYGPSRGTTISPLLKGVKLTLAIKKDTVVNYNGLTHLAGIDMTSEEFIEAFRNYDDLKKMLEETAERKKGRKSNKEKDFISKGEKGIIEKDGEVSHTIGNIGNRATVYHDNREIVNSDEQDFLSKFGKYAQNAKHHKVVKILFRPSGTPPSGGSGKPTVPQSGGGNNQPKNPPSGGGSNQPNNPQSGGNNVPPQPKNNGGTTNTDNKKLDTSLAKSNPKEFISNNFDKIDSIVSLAESKGLSLDVDGMVESLGNGDYSSFEEIEDLINNYQ